MNHPSAEAQKDLYESLAAVHLSVTTPDGPGAYARGEELVELARTLAKGGPYAATVERFARDHGYGRRDPEPASFPADLLEPERRRLEDEAELERGDRLADPERVRRALGGRGFMGLDT